LEIFEKNGGKWLDKIYKYMIVWKNQWRNT
jgi:hypothetical protein